MDLTTYFNLQDNTLSFSKAQGSAFAKEIAGDFNPIHNVDAKRFCIPGDLLFAVMLWRYGAYQSMQFDFAGMVGEGIELALPADIETSFSLCDTQGKAYVEISMQGDHYDNPAFISELSQAYVQFSGQTFPDILVDLMKREGVMINPDRPLVIYRNMQIHLNAVSSEAVSLDLENCQLAVNGKKGEVSLNFGIRAGDTVIGSGCKSMVLSGLRDYDQAEIDRIIDEYAGWKSAYQAR